MPSISAIRAAVGKTVENAIPDLMIYASVPEVVRVPAIVVIPSDCDYSGAMQRGMHVWGLDIYVLVGNTGDQESDELDEMINGFGPKSIPEIIYTNSSIGLIDVDAYVSHMVGYGGKFETAGVKHTGAILKVVVRTLGTS